MCPTFSSDTRWGVEVVTEPLVPGLVPQSRRGQPLSPQQFAQVSSGHRVLPLSELPAVPCDVELLCRIASIDAQGRVAEQSVVRALGWGDGQRLDIRVSSGAVIVRSDASGVFTLARRCQVLIPASVRRWCDLRPRDRVLLAVDIERAVLVIHTMSAVQDMLRARHVALLDGERS